MKYLLFLHGPRKSNETGCVVGFVEVSKKALFALKTHLANEQRMGLELVELEDGYSDIHSKWFKIQSIDTKEGKS